MYNFLRICKHLFTQDGTPNVEERNDFTKVQVGKLISLLRLPTGEGTIHSSYIVGDDRWKFPSCPSFRKCHQKLLTTSIFKKISLIANYGNNVKSCVTF